MESFAIWKSDTTGSYYFILGRARYDITRTMVAHDEKIKQDTTSKIVEEFRDKLKGLAYQDIPESAWGELIDNMCNRIGGKR